MQSPPPPFDPKRLPLFLGGLVVFMLGLAFLSVPLYRIFCTQTGFGGTPRIATAKDMPKTIKERKIKVYFTANTHRDLPWSFETKQLFTNVRLGQAKIVFYHAKNTSNEPIVGMATYNVTPEKAASYFNKIACFCFEEQLLQPGESMNMPLQFFIDPDFDKDSLLDDVNEITLSYTFFRYSKDKGVPIPLQTAPPPMHNDPQ